MTHGAGRFAAELGAIPPAIRCTVCGRLHLPSAVLHDHHDDADRIALRCPRCGIIDAPPRASLEPALRALLDRARTKQVG